MAGIHLWFACGEIRFIITSSLPDGSQSLKIMAKISDGTTDITLHPKKTWDDEVCLEELLEKEEMPSTMPIPSSPQGIDFMAQGEMEKQDQCNESGLCGKG